MIEAGHRGRTAKGEPAASVIAAGEFHLHVALAFARLQRELLKDRFIDFECDARRKVHGSGAGVNAATRTLKLHGAGC